MNASTFPSTIPELLQWRARQSPTWECYMGRDNEGGWTPTTWEGLWRKTRRVAAWLRQAGLAPGERLAIQAPPCASWELFHFASLFAGASVVGIDPQAPVEHAALHLRESGARALVVARDSDLVKIPDVIRNALKFIIVLQSAGSALGGKVLAWDEGQVDSDTPELNDCNFPAPSDPAALIFTSGSTGSSKLIEYTHQQILVACQAIAGAFPELEPGERTIGWLPMSHLFQRMMNLVAVARGVATYFVEDPREMMDRVREIQPSYLIGVPRFFEKLQNELERNAELYAPWKRCLKFMITGSAPIAPSLLEYFYRQDLLVLEAYGLTENTVPMAANRVSDFRFGSVGKLFPQNEYRFAEDGEILVRGPGLFQGYYGQERPADRFTSDGFYRTGDCGRLDQDGFLFLTGRISDMMKTSTGRKISPAHVEAVYSRCRYLDQVVVVGHGRKYLTALVTLNTTALEMDMRKAGYTPPNAEEMVRSTWVRRTLQQAIRELDPLLAPYEQVRKFAVLPEPLTVAGGELTATLKPRREQIETRYCDLIEHLYHTDEPLAAGSPAIEDTHTLLSAIDH